MNRLRRSFYLLFALPLVWFGCTDRAPQYRIGVSQCLDDTWRQKMNAEMDCEMLLHPDMTLSRRIAYGSNELQCAQIDSFIAEGVDLLIVSPNDPDRVQPAVSRAYRAGIPVIIADRHVAGDEWTAFIGGDNYAVGQLMAEWVKEELRIKNYELRIKDFTILEVTGMEESVPEQLRHQGFMDGMAEAFPDAGTMPSIYSVSGCKDAYSAVSVFLKEHARVDAIVAQNDIMAIESAKAVNAAPGYGKGSVPIMGVDGISMGLQAIVNGDMECTAVYPTRGDLIIHTATKILRGEPYARDTILETMLIDAGLAYPLLRQFEAMEHELNTMQLVRLQSQNQWREMKRNKHLLLGIIAVLALLFLSVLVFVIAIQRNMRAKITSEIIPQLEDVKEAIQLSNRDAAFMENIRQIVDDNLTNPELNVEFLSSALQLDRTQVFRRLKAITGKGPLDYIRERRLIRADELLNSTDMTVRQVAYELRFASPGYFSKYYKQYFGHLPSKR
ncbi:MAG: substrate-binding domain-containing protein [Paludibacteraceae bacterium]|nr:substrate-binding domain-containing protein [Paludibacteraceae bacterium]